MTTVAFTLFYSKMLTFTLFVGFVVKGQTTTTGKMAMWLIRNIHISDYFGKINKIIIIINLMLLPFCLLYMLDYVI